MLKWLVFKVNNKKIIVLLLNIVIPVVLNIVVLVVEFCVLSLKIHMNNPHGMLSFSYESFKKEIDLEIKQQDGRSEGGECL